MDQFNNSVENTNSVASEKVEYCHNKWQKIVVSGGIAPSQRSLHVAVQHKNTFYVFGGYDGVQRTNDFYGLDLKTKCWMRMEVDGEIPPPRDRHVGVIYQNYFVIFGGYDGSKRVNDFYKYNFDTGKWSRIDAEANVPSPRHSHSAVVHRNSMYVFGGYDGLYRNDLYQYNFVSEEWSQVPYVGRIPKPRYRTSLVVDGDRMLMFGGHDGGRHLNGVHSFDFGTNTWDTIPTEGPVPIPRDSHIACLHDNCMFIFGGSTGSAMNDFHKLDLKNATWEVLQARGQTPSPRFCHAGVKRSKSLVIFGGYDGAKRLNDCYQFEFGPGPMSCKIPRSTLVRELLTFVNNPKFSDIQFVIGGERIYAHKLMCMRCSYFNAMFTGSMKESNAQEVEIHDVDRDIFVTLLEYLYTDEVRVSLDNAMDLFVVADKFGVERLQKLCENTMLGSITIDNAPGMLLAADRHNALTLKEQCLMYVVQHFDMVSKTAQFETMARENIDLMFEILSSR